MNKFYNIQATYLEHDYWDIPDEINWYGVGLTKWSALDDVRELLKQEHRNMAKLYHPDVHSTDKDVMDVIMGQVNVQYDRTDQEWNTIKQQMSSDVNHVIQKFSLFDGANFNDMDSDKQDIIGDVILGFIKLGFDFS